MEAGVPLGGLSSVVDYVKVNQNFALFANLNHMFQEPRDVDLYGTLHWRRESTNVSHREPILIN